MQDAIALRTQTAPLGGRYRHPRAWRPTSLAFGVLAIFSAAAYEAMPQDGWAWLGVICCAGILIAAISMVVALRDGAKRFLTDHLLILVAAFAMYFLFGPLLLVFGPEEEAAYALSWYPTTARAAVLVTTMNLTGLAILLFVAGFVPDELAEHSVAPIDSFLGKLPASKVFWTFIVIGGFCTYEVAVFDLSQSGEVISGLFRTISQTLIIAILIGVMYQGPGAIFIRITAFAVAACSSFVGLLMFNKSAFFYPWLVILVGAYLRRPSIRWVVVAVAALGIALVALARPIGDARVALRGGQDFETRWTILKSVFSDSEEDGGFDSGAGPWSRLCYAAAQVAAVDLYQSDLGGNDFELAGWVLLPRALFPEKPVITQSGVDFNLKVTGYDTSSSGMGLFISGYYNMGWLGLIIVSVGAGVILAVYCAFSRAVVAAGSVLLLPVTLLGSFTAFRIDGHFLSDFWGSFAMVMIPLLLVGAVLRPQHSAKAIGLAR